jgi:hypothetical protein
MFMRCGCGRFKLEALVYGNNTEEQALALYAMCEQARFNKTPYMYKHTYIHVRVFI